NTSNANGHLRGQVIPYADQRAYTDRLNALFSPAGWTRKYAVHTSANFHRAKDQKTTAKVFVTCDLTIFGLGSHSATGEEWADDENAVTSAEAQAFKRAASCFGLGRYLYHFTGTWVDLDDRKRPKTKPKLACWATAEGWKQGLRPGHTSTPDKKDNAPLRPETARELVRQIEAMAQPLGKALYRGLLKSVARAWNPSDIKDPEVLERLLAHMQGAERGLRRLEAAYLHTGVEPLAEILHSRGIRDMDQVSSLELLEKIVLALEDKVKKDRSR
ncbi:MAG: Rad52/Rad22 family DNA repair protein, partial [Candidatus Angelobacter sp.]